MSTSMNKSKAHPMSREGARLAPHPRAGRQASPKVTDQVSARAAVEPLAKGAGAARKSGSNGGTSTGARGAAKRGADGGAPAATPGSKGKATVVRAQAVARPAVRKATSGQAPGRAQVRPRPVAAEPVAVVRPRGKAAVASPRGLHDKVRIFQIYYRPEQRQFLDPSFEPYDNAGERSPLLEFHVFRKLMDAALPGKAELWGALSWKFKEKTGLSGEQLRQIIASHPGHDVYYCNPFPELEGLYHNLWLQGETSHPNFMILSREFFLAAGLGEGELTRLVPSSQFAASNYFVATPAFWRGYVDFISDVMVRAESRMSATAKAMIYSTAADRKAMHAGASYMPFILERLFGVYLHRTQGQYRLHKFSCERQETRLNVHLQLLRQMKDVAISSKSLWMATCWVNYRNLYLSQSHGSAWCRTFLKSVTPSQIDFGAQGGEPRER